MESRPESGDEPFEYRSCCAEEEEWQDTADSFTAGGDSKEVLEESSVRMLFKGVSSSLADGTGVSGIGVFMERCPELSALRVQKKLDFFVDELVADHLALLDGLLAALENGVKKVYAFTDSEKLYFQIAEAEILEDPLLVALAHRILELVEKLDDFDIMLVPCFDVQRASRLAQEAAGLVDHAADNVCPMCSRDGQALIPMNCSHGFCSRCLFAYVEMELRASRVPIQCLQSGCRYHISAEEFRSFLPDACFESLKGAFLDAGLSMGRFCCPFPDCSAILGTKRGSCVASTSTLSGYGRFECPQCRRDICTGCWATWQGSTTCEECQSGICSDNTESSMLRLAGDSSWRCCPQCTSMIELSDGCYHMICWCGNEFCFACGAEYASGVQTCRCMFWDDTAGPESLLASMPIPNSDLWAWNAFDDCVAAPNSVEGYSEQETAHLALIQQFLAGGFGLADEPSLRSLSPPPPRRSNSFSDSIKDLHQLPWLERFVSVISDNYGEDFI